VEKWKAELWALKLDFLRATNDEVFKAHSVMTDRVFLLEGQNVELSADIERLRTEQMLSGLPAQDQRKCAFSAVYSS
jgi:hypothetical protein